MINVEKRRLVFLLSQHEENRLEELACSQQEKQVNADVNFQPLIFGEKEESLAFPEMLKGETEFPGTPDKDCANDHLEDLKTGWDSN